jgi:hypothetical protein
MFFQILISSVKILNFKITASNNLNIRQAHQYLYELRPTSAEKILKAEEIKNPDNSKPGGNAGMPEGLSSAKRQYLIISLI